MEIHTNTHPTKIPSNAVQGVLEKIENARQPTSEFKISTALAISGLFDTNYYLEQNPDVAESDIDPIMHYTLYGAKEGRSPAKWFYGNIFTEMAKYTNPLYYHLKTCREIIPIVFIADDSFAKYLSVAICSIKENKQKHDKHDIYILHKDIKTENKKKLSKLSSPNFSIHFLNIEKAIKDYLFCGAVHISSIAQSKILIPSFFQLYHKVLYIDCDVVVNNNINILLNIDLHDNTIGAGKDFCSSQFMSTLQKNMPPLKNTYFNSGVMLINTNKFLKKNMQNNIYNLMKKHKSDMVVDQYYFNLALYDSVLFIDNNWNFQWHPVIFNHDSFKEENKEYLKNLDRIGILHFTSHKKPWNHYVPNFSNIFWKYAKLSPFYSEIKSEYEHATGKTVEDI